MSERWKYQIKTGGFYGIFMTLAFTLWDVYATSFEEAFWSKKFIIRLVAFLLVGIFVIGYFNWRDKQQKINNCKKT